MANWVGQQLGNYRMIRLLGEGGFAEVYLGEHIHLGTQAAIKVLHTQLTSDDVDKFRVEARTIARLIHPHIVRVLDFGVEGKTPFLVMDYASNGTLRQRHPKGVAVLLPLIVAYVKQVAEALQYTHDEKLIHRDIKPENMLLGQRNDILLSDFGIALVAQSSRYQSAQEMAGTMAYMAPEQIQGKPRPASDQYSLGIVVYEWLTGDRPFHGSLTELVGQHLSVLPPFLHEKVPTIPPEVEQVVLTALAKEPKQRFPSVQAFATALEQVSQSAQPASSVVTSPLCQLPQSKVAATPLPPSQSSQPTKLVTPLSQSQQSSVVTTPPTSPIAPPFPSLSQFLPSSGSQLSKHRLSRRTIVAGLAGLAIAGGSLTWLAFSQKQQVSSPSFRPTFTARISTLTPTPTPIHQGTTLLTYHGHTDDVRGVTWSPDGKRIASASTDKTVQVWDAASGNTFYTYRGHSEFLEEVKWSSDGTFIASSGGDSTVQVFDATTGSHVFTYRGHSQGQDVRAIAWSPDGKRIASASDDTTVQVFDATTGSHVFTYRGHADGVYAVAWSPNGKYIASGGGKITTGGGDTTVQVWDATTGGTVLIYNGPSTEVVAVVWSPDSRRIASGNVNNTVNVWNAASGNTFYTYRHHSSVVYTVAWSPNGNFIASGGYQFDNTVQIWNAATGNTFYTYRSHANGVNAVAWSPDGKRIASASLDKTIRVWQAM